MLTVNILLSLKLFTFCIRTAFQIITETNKKKEIYNQEKLPLITWRNHFLATQLTFTCSKSTVETLKKGIKYVQSLQ